MQKIGEVQDPLHGYKQEIVVAPVEELTVIEIQRKPSQYHVRRLAESMRKVGFVTPLIAVKRNGNLVVIDGQHRLLAAKAMGIDKVPCIVLPDKFANELMELNVEKTMSLREKCYVALNLYRIFLNEKPELKEDDAEILDAIEYPYFITLGLAYEERQKFFGSAYESLTKRLDWFLDVPLKEAFEKRKERSKILLRIDEKAREAVEKVKELGISHPFLYREIISFCNPIGRKRKVEEEFEEVMQSLEANLDNLLQNPEMIREHKFSEEMEV
ncbi:MAG: ParB-like nuclease domain-containing protein [Thermoplasmata archaeon]|nr:ParB-like nuclease domain-containing protein [Thermoplasmata archaeon]